MVHPLLYTTVNRYFQPPNKYVLHSSYCLERAKKHEAFNSNVGSFKLHRIIFCVYRFESQRYNNLKLTNYCTCTCTSTCTSTCTKISLVHSHYKFVFVPPPLSLFFTLLILLRLITFTCFWRFVYYVLHYYLFFYQVY